MEVIAEKVISMKTVGKRAVVADSVEFTIHGKQGVIVLEFFGDDGKTVNRQPITLMALRAMPFLSEMANISYYDPKRATAIMKTMVKKEKKQVAKRRKATRATKA